MKKLMIAAAIVCAAVCANAASANWNIYTEDDIETADGTGYFNGTMTLACSALGFSETVTLSNGAFDEYFDIDCEYLTDYTFTLTTETATHKYSASTVGQTDNSGNGMAGFAAGTWTPVPEPTSAMLLLLGMAGLALKRKRA